MPSRRSRPRRVGSAATGEASGQRTRASVAGRRRATSGSRSGGPVAYSKNELQSLVRLGDRRALVVDETGVQPDPLDRIEVQVSGDARGLLRPRDPQAPGRREGASERGEVSGEI